MEQNWACELCQDDNSRESDACATCGHPRDFGAKEPVEKRPKRGAQTNKAAAPAPPPAGLKWNSVEESMRVLTSPALQKPSDKVVAFDMDSTLIVPSSGAKFPRSRGDWTWWHESVPEKLKKLHADGYKLIIFSNQAGIEKKNQKESDITGKVEDLSRALSVPLVAYLATATDRSRKPHTTMWDHFVAHSNGKRVPADALYVGDAAGRLPGWRDAKTKKDFSCSDRKFAANCKIRFATPEEFFLGQPPTTKWSWGGPDPKDLLAKYDKPSSTSIAPIGEQELVLLVGMAAAGKSTLAKGVFEKAGYVRANNDDHGNKQKCLKICKEALAAGRSVVIDNTNPDAATRAMYLDLARQHGVKRTRCFMLHTPREVCDHLNLFREYVQNVRRVPGVAFNTYNKRLEAPTTKEGFSEVINVDFTLRFAEPIHREYFLQWQ